MCDNTKDRWIIEMVDGLQVGVYADDKFDAMVQAVTATGQAARPALSYKVASAWPNRFHGRIVR